MRGTTVKVLAKLVCYTLVALWFIKTWYFYVYKGHLLYDVKNLLVSRKQLSDLSDEFIEHHKPKKTADFSGLFSARELEEIDVEYVEPIEKGCCAIDYEIGYQGEQIEVKTWNCRERKEHLYKDDLYGAELRIEHDTKKIGMSENVELLKIQVLELIKETKELRIDNRIGFTTHKSLE